MVILHKFKEVKICTSGDHVQKSTTKLYNYSSVILARLTTQTEASKGYVGIIISSQNFLLDQQSSV